MSTQTNINEYRSGTVGPVFTIPIGTGAARYYYHWTALAMAGLAAIGSERALSLTNTNHILQAQGHALSLEICQLIS